MKALASSSCSKKIVIGRNRDSSFCSWREFNPTNRHKTALFPYKKLNNVGLLHLISVQRKPLLPIHASEPSVSQESQEDLVVAEESKNQEAYQSKTVHVRFQLNKECSFGEQFVVVGDDPIFGMWDPENAIQLNWSDGHVWILELDIPIGKTIQFKFILKDVSGKISWQPGPDRILKTWETNNTIVVCEDWEDATFQKLIEEEPNTSNQNKGPEPADNSEMLIVADNLAMNSEVQSSENLIHKNEELRDEELISDANNGFITANVSSDQAKESLPLAHEKPIIADNFSSSEEKPMAIVADNISSSKVDSGVALSYPKRGGKKDGNEAIAEEILGNNGKGLTAQNSVSIDVEGGLANHEGEPVLVPGLPPLSADSSEQEIQRLPSLSVDSSEPEIQHKEESSTFVASVGAVEVENQNRPELDEKHEIEDDLHQAETIKVFNNEELVLDELDQKPSANDEKQHESTPVESTVIKNDIQWGRRTIQKLLTNLGFL